MRTMLGALAIAASLGLPAVAFAQDDECPCPLGQADAAAAGPTLTVADDDEAETIREIEARLNELLLVDDTGRIVLREEFKEAMPFPPQRLEMMLGSFVELDDDGRIRLKNIEMIRPYLPMIRGFLGQGGLDKLQELQKLPPEERREAMRRLFGQGEGGGGPFPFGARPEREREQPRTEERRAERRRDDRAPSGRRPPASEARPGSPRGDILERLERMERTLERIEGMLERDGRGPSARRHRRDRAEREGEGRRGGFMRRLFDRDGERGGRGRGLFQRGRVWSDGLRKLMELMQPDDLDRLRRTFDALREDVGPDDLRDPGKLMQKAQGKLSPEDMARFMELFSQFLATEEGRELVAEVEATVRQLEDFVNSPEGERAGEALRRLQERMGNGGERGESLQDRVEQLIRPRREGERREQPRSSARRRHGQEDGPRSRERETPSAPRPPGSRLY